MICHSQGQAKFKGRNIATRFHAEIKSFKSPTTCHRNKGGSRILQSLRSTTRNRVYVPHRNSHKPHSPIRIPNAAAQPPTPHALLEAPLFPEVWLGVGLVKVEDGEGEDDDDNTEDNDEGGGGNDIEVAEGPTLQNL